MSHKEAGNPPAGGQAMKGVKRMKASSATVIDADRAPSAKDWKHDPAAYSRRCRNIRRSKERIKTAYVQRLFAVAVALLAVVGIVALAVS